MPKHTTCRAALHNLKARLPWFAVRRPMHGRACDHEFAFVMSRHA